MAHPSKNVLKHVRNNTNGFTQDLVFPLENGICPGCAKGKMHNKPFPPVEKSALKPFKLIHADLIELPIRSYHKKKWVCMIMDNYSSYAYCFLLRSKDETYTAVKQFLELIKTQHNMVVKQFRSDRGGEFKSKKFDELLAAKRIVRQTSAPHIHQQNGQAE